MTEALPELVLLPGLDGTGVLFERLQKILPSAVVKVTVIAYPPDASMTYRDYVALVKGSLGSRRVVLLGESFSGPIAIMLAAEIPEHVRGLILSATFLRSPWPRWLVHLGSLIDPSGTPAGARNTVLMGRSRDTELARTISNIVAAMPPGVRAARIQAVSKVDVRTQFAGLACPILALHDTADWIVPKRQLEVAIRTMSNARWEMIPGAHMLLQTQPKIAAQHILKFIQTLN